MNDCQDIIINTKAVKQFCRPQNMRERASAVRGMPVPIMQFSCSVNRQTHEKLIVMEKRSPLLINCIAVCLERELQPTVIL